MDSRTIYVSASLFCLPVLALCFVLCLPLIVLLTANLYVCAWAAYLYEHRSEAPSWMQLLRHLPCLPSTVFRINASLLQLAMTYIKHIPTLFIYLKWRYWTMRSRMARIVRRRVVYSKADPKTCQLDVYYPDTTAPQTPIIVFVHGSATSLPNHRTYYTLFANTLRELGYIVAVPNFKHEGHIKLAIKWAYRHACERQLDPEMIYVLGHGTGAHKVVQIVLSDALKKAKCYTNALPSGTDSDNSGKHDPSAAAASTISSLNNDDHLYDFLPQVEGLLLFAGIYDRNGESDNSHHNNPLQLIKENRQLFETSRDLIDFFPRILFVHGDKDTTALVEESVEMYSLLGDVLPPDRREEVDVRMRLYKKLNHTQCITALMPTLGSYDRMNKLLCRDIKEFIDPPTSQPHQQQQDLHE
ncbi:Alpha/Beta hydrolase protein [Zychaea mexicana]|uniref:Alpha/Beta hydrolase protein n=1 Tax=Zychaea mexicana TaxID=64656 RepID=UPI0022FE90FC|nr:Alpha/Beta hydrolase protein [Zychaea mexicana]KAI9497677.1 Alpha/Beta hydrolase protein [Zychaea mexicana]